MKPAALAIAFALLAFPALAAEAPVVGEAKAFMASYADALRAGDRAGVAARYDRTGSWIVGGGESRLYPYADQVSFYAGKQWNPPEAFEWVGLGYEPLGPDAVVVTGAFKWDPAGPEAAKTIAYTALLVRQDGVLRIRLEHE